MWIILHDRFSNFFHRTANKLFGSWQHEKAIENLTIDKLDINWTVAIEFMKFLKENSDEICIDIPEELKIENVLRNYV